MSRWNGLLQVLTLRCEAASGLSSRELDEPLSRLERTALLCHLLVCRSCRRFRTQIRALRESIRGTEWPLAGVDSDEGRLSPEARDRIARAVRESSGGQSGTESPPDSYG